LPEASPVRRGGVSSIGVFGCSEIILVSSGAEACKQNNECAEEEEDHSCKQCPDRYTKLRVTATRILAAIIDVVLDDAKQREVGREDHNTEGPGERSCEGGEQCAANARTQSHEEGNECHAADDGMEDHDAGESFSGVFLGIVEGCLVGLRNEESGIISNVASCAEVLVILGTSNIKHAVSEGTQGDRGMAYRR